MILASTTKLLKINKKPKYLISFIFILAYFLNHLYHSNEIDNTYESHENRV